MPRRTAPVTAITDTAHPALSRRAVAAIAAGGLVLFLGIGMRQGFGLFYLPVAPDLDLTREAFARTVAVQYLLFGLAGPVAGLLAERTSTSTVLSVGAFIYALGFALSSFVSTPGAFFLTSGLLLGCGVGFIHFGVITATVIRLVPTERRGAALGTVAAVGALGQLLLLFFTQLSIDAVGWRQAMQAHALLLLLIPPIALCLRDSGQSLSVSVTSEALSVPLNRALRTSKFWLLSVGFGFSGLHVMFVMTHLPAMVGDLGLSAGDAVTALAALSGASFVGSWVFGRLCDRFPAHRLLVLIYLARAGMALVAWQIEFSKASLFAYCFLLGLVWMCTMPVTGHLTAQLFGAKSMASVYGAVFLVHQIGGFAGTWLGGVVFDQTGSYGPMWVTAGVLCVAAAGLAAFLRPSH